MRMLVGLLKTFLYTILVLILLWVTTIILGPSALKYMTQKYYGEKIKFIGLNVSPRLKISASRIEFNNLFLQNIGQSSGFVRATSFSLKNYKDGKLFFELLTGPIEIYNIAKVSSTSTLASIEGFNTAVGIGLLVDFKEVGSQDKFFLKSFKGRGRFNPYGRTLSDVDFEAEEISQNFLDQVSVRKASGKISGVDFNQPFDRSISSFSMLLEKASTKNEIFSLSEMFFQGNLESKDQQLELRLNNFKFRDSEIVKFITVERSGDGYIKDRIGLFKYTVNGIDLTKFETIPSLVSIKQIDGEIGVQDIGEVGLFAQGEFEKFELVSGSQYVADLSGREFDLDVHLHKYQSGLIVKTDFGLKISNDPFVNVNGDLSVKLIGQSGVMCAFTGCSLKEFVINYDFVAKDSSLVGSSMCAEKACSAGNFSHSIRTLDTQRFFLGLMESKAFNPLALIIAQSQLQMGVEVGDGHEVKF